MKDVVIIGAGGFGRETAWLISQLPKFRLLGFIDDAMSQSPVKNVPWIGTREAIHSLPKDTGLVVAIANPAIRQRIVQQIGNDFDFPNIIYPTAILGAKENTFGKGNIITAGTILTVNVHVGNFCIINLSSTIGHDTILSDYCSLMPQCSISGAVKLGERCFVGAGARILQNLELGNDCVVGAGAVVTKSFGSSVKLMGVPAKEYVD